jgi:hypothetical protein
MQLKETDDELMLKKSMLKVKSKISSADPDDEYVKYRGTYFYAIGILSYLRC